MKGDGLLLILKDSICGAFLVDRFFAVAIWPPLIILNAHIIARADYKHKYNRYLLPVFLLYIFAIL